MIRHHGTHATDDSVEAPETTITVRGKDDPRPNVIQKSPPLANLMGAQCHYQRPAPVNPKGICRSTGDRTTEMDLVFRLTNLLRLLVGLPRRFGTISTSSGFQAKKELQI